ncbi:hypothetical protein D9615_004376 [Tricholomella constricta]|uniref:Uncharacterized protein n=1 Tax=Tricholomella constricta TaxID=117010 RepID=A0A8H5HF05_9AGAR|nr:hypothetical protein D9615_004376 [Tricholomella constricta]
MYAEGAEIENTSVVRQASEFDPLLGEGEEEFRKPFYRARPLWLVPFAITAALVRGMTLAPRIEVFTQLSCNRLYGHDRYNHTKISISIPTTHTIPQEAVTPFYFSLDPLGPPLHPHQLHRAATRPNVTLLSGLSVNDDDEGEGDPRRLPSQRCLGDPAVQAGAARLQTMMTTTMGLLSALTTGWWGHFGERHGRTKVLAIVTLGLFLTDLTFILVSTPSSPFSAHGHKLLVLAPIVEGLLGGWSTLSSATSAYLSDCTSSGSRAYIFSRFAGVFYIGLSAGPSIGGYLIRNPLWKSERTDGALSVTCVFWVAIICSFVNFVLVLFVFPESLDKVKRQRALAEHHVKASVKGKARADDAEIDGQGSGASGEERAEARQGIVRSFLKPLALFLPAVVYEGGVRKRRDWSLTFLAAALFGSTLSNGVHQVKYLYAVHVYEWGAGQLSYYISFLSGARAVFLLILCPWIIRTFKPKPQPEIEPDSGTNEPVTKTKKPKPTKSHLAREISFDLIMTRFSLMIDILSNTFVTLGPMPAVHTLGGAASFWTQESQSLFVLATALSSMGSGAGPAMQSLALCIVQVRGLDAAAAGGKVAATANEGGVGQLFGALAVLQTLGQMILGPMIFGLVYSGTVAAYPKGVFVTAAGLLFCSLMLVMLVRGPVIPNAGGPVPGRSIKKGKRKAQDGERGRSRVSKDLRGEPNTGLRVSCVAIVALVVPVAIPAVLPRPLALVAAVDVVCPAAVAHVVGYDLGTHKCRSRPLHYTSFTTPSVTFNAPALSASTRSASSLACPPQTHPTYLSSTQDLLARFHLLPAYDRYVRPFAAPAETGLDQAAPPPVTLGATGTVDKGKGKEVDGLPATPGAADGGDGDDDEGGKGDKKKRNNYKHLIKGIPGKHSTKKDDYLTTMMQVPPKQRIHITPFDLKTQREAFTVSLEGLKGWNPGALVLESAQAREDRKRRKEAKRLQKLQVQAQNQAALAASVAPPQPIQAPVPTSATASSFHRPLHTSVFNAVPGVQRPSSTVPVPGSTATKPAIARPGSTVPRPGSTVSRPGSAKPTVTPVQVPLGRVSTPLRSGVVGPGTPLRTTVTPASANPYQLSIDSDKRGKKRERDDVTVAGNVIGATNVNGNIAATNPPKAVLNAKAGTAGIRPRPIKKQRMDMQGQARDVAVTQQPTPQGV